ncbi:hypothetical protein ADUPG1_011649 [Aduncisulcus paluster]|uniref:Uncharacterized protein n=1 Tax=Aduncisulcus paluster TaxID=2918883 RepID=A0ABQ5JWK7_9EUKA|nr:hypothetical protein ADUPG1_011649 [Aduncisulcus paluster]
MEERIRREREEEELRRQIEEEERERRRKELEEEERRRREEEEMRRLEEERRRKEEAEREKSALLLYLPHGLSLSFLSNASQHDDVIRSLAGFGACTLRSDDSSVFTVTFSLSGIADSISEGVKVEEDAYLAFQGAMEGKIGVLDVADVLILKHEVILSPRDGSFEGMGSMQGRIYLGCATKDDASVLAQAFGVALSRAYEGLE